MNHMNDSVAVQRIRRLLDESSFVELGAYVTARSTDFNMADHSAPGDGVVTGYGTINGKLVFVYSQDPAVLGGSVGEMHARKIVRIYDKAIKMGAPVIAMIDCAGFRLQESYDALNAFAKIYRMQSLASGVIPQFQVVYGTCGGTMSISSALCDFTFIEKEKGKIFIYSPNSVSDRTEAEFDTASADFHVSKSGIADFAGTEEEIVNELRNLVDIIPSNNETPDSEIECTDDLNRLIEGAAQMDVRSLITELADNRYVVEPGREYGSTLATAFIRLNGKTVGVIANTYDEIGYRALAKGARFISYCDSFRIPLLLLVHSKGYKKDLNTEKFLARRAANLTTAYAKATVPKVTVINGEIYASNYIMLGSRALGADTVLAWPEANIALMDAAEAVKVIYAEEIQKAENKGSVYRQKLNEYITLQNGIVGAAKRGYVDDIIYPEVTRKRVIVALEMLYSKSVDRTLRKHGTGTV